LESKEEETKTPARRRELQSSAYRMVFSNQRENNHNRTNIRDRSTDPSNIYGDANIRVGRDLSDDDEPPPLENVRNRPLGSQT
jgi:hypothetical protein